MCEVEKVVFRPLGWVTPDYNSIMGNDRHNESLHSFSRLLINSWPQIFATNRFLLTKPRKVCFFPHSCSFTSSIFSPLLSHLLLKGTKPFPQLLSGHADGFWVEKSSVLGKIRLDCVGGTFANAHKTFTLLLLLQRVSLQAQHAISAGWDYGVTLQPRLRECLGCF